MKRRSVLSFASCVRDAAVRRPSTRRTILLPSIVLVCLVTALGLYGGQYVSPPRDPAVIAREFLPDHPTYWHEPLDLVVRVFDPETGEWHETIKREVVPGQEFVAANRLFKETIYGWMSETHGEVDVNKLSDATAAYNPVRKRAPEANDVVYVFGRDLSRAGFQTLAYVEPGRRFRFLGRIYKTVGDITLTHIRVVDTGETLDRAGGDPDFKPPRIFLTAQTAHLFANQARLGRTESTRGLAINHDTISKGADHVD